MKKMKQEPKPKSKPSKHDKRRRTYKEMSERILKLQQKFGIDSYQKELLMGRAAFLSIQIEYMETTTSGGDEFDGTGSLYVQMVNTLLKILEALER